MFKISQTCFASWPRARINYSHESESVSFSLQVLKFNLSAVVLPIVPKTDLDFELILYITILFSKVQAAALNPRSVFKTHLKAHRSSCFHRRWRKQKLFTRKVWGLRSRWSSILRPPKHLFMFSLSILSAREVICPFTEWKQDSESLKTSPATRHNYLHFFERVIWRQKTVFLGPLKSPKNMLRKSIFIGLFVLNNNRTIAGPKSLQGG